MGTEDMQAADAPGQPDAGQTVRLASIVAADIVGFSTMSERDQHRAAKQVETLRARIEAVAAANRGRLFNTAGDGFMLEFGSAGDALSAIQNLIDKRPKGEPLIRVGAHVGDVVVTATRDLLGHGVNVAARLQSLARPGSALVSAEFRSMARNSPTAAFQPRGRQPLDNIEQKVQTFEILSQRQKFKRLAARAGWTLAALAAAVAAAFVSPQAWRMAQDLINPDRVAAASQPGAAPPQNLIEPIETPPPDQLPETEVSYITGQVFRDCADCPEMTVLSGGLFVMGSPNEEEGRQPDEGPQREVSIAPFAMGRTEVTFAQWDACVAAEVCAADAGADRGWGRGARPVIGVSWSDAQAFIGWLNAQVGRDLYRLPSEAEWEFAARAGSRTPYAEGETLAISQAAFRARRTSTVGAFEANAFGLVDMAGNAAEWVRDCHANNYALAPVDGEAMEFEGCPERVYRGGYYTDYAPALRAAARASAAPDARPIGVGFRVARDLQ